LSISFQGHIIVDSVKYTAQDIRSMIEKLKKVREFCNGTECVGLCDPSIRRYEQERVDEHNAVKRAVLEIIDEKINAPRTT